MKINSTFDYKLLVGPVVGLVISVLCFIVGFQCHRTPETPVETKTETVTKTDTITQWKTKTVSVTKPVPVYSTLTKTVHDTLPVIKTIHSHSRDTVYASVEVPVSSQKYSDEQVLQDSTRVSYNAIVSGYRASLDSLQFHVTYPERHINTSTVTTTTSVKRKHFGVGVSVGAGYGIINRKPDIFIGLSAVYLF